MKSLLDDLVDTCYETEDTPKSAPINPSKEINYWLVTRLLLNKYKDEQGKRSRYQKLYVLIDRWHEVDDINIKNLDRNNIQIDEKSYNNILIFYIGHMTLNIYFPLPEELLSATSFKILQISWVRYKCWNMIELLSQEVKMLVKPVDRVGVLFVTTGTLSG